MHSIWDLGADPDIAHALDHLAIVDKLFYGMKRTIDFPAGDANDSNLDSDAELVGTGPLHYGGHWMACL